MTVHPPDEGGTCKNKKAVPSRERPWLGNLTLLLLGAALLEHLVDQRCLAVIDVRDDRYVSDILSLHSIPSIPFAFFESTESKNCKFHFDTPIIFDRYK